MGQPFGNNRTKTTIRRCGTGALALAALLAMPGTAAAFYLGNIKVTSALGEPFQAEVPFDLRPEEEPKGLTSNIGAADEYGFLDLHRTLVVNTLRTEVVRDDQGNRIVVTGDTPVNAPFFNLLLKTSLGRGAHFRNYPVFLDLPQKDQALITAGPTTVPARPPAAPVSVVRIPAAATMPAEGHYGPVRAGETLATIAEKLKPATGQTLSQLMVAIWQRNKERFLQGNINGLPKGVVLEIPSRDEQERVSHAEALAELQRQWKIWRGLIPPDRTPVVTVTAPVPGSRTGTTMAGAADPISDALPTTDEIQAPAEPQVAIQPAAPAVEEIVPPAEAMPPVKPEEENKTTTPSEPPATATVPGQPAPGDEQYDLRLTVAPQGDKATDDSRATTAAPPPPPEPEVVSVAPELILKLDQGIGRIRSLGEELSQVSAELKQESEARVRIESQLSLVQKRLAALERELRQARMAAQRGDAPEQNWILYGAAAALVALVAGLLAFYNRRKRRESQEREASEAALPVVAATAAAAGALAGAEPTNAAGADGADEEGIPPWSPDAPDDGGDGLDGIPQWSPDDTFNLDGVELPDLDVGGESAATTPAPTPTPAPKRPAATMPFSAEDEEEEEEDTTIPDLDEGTLATDDDDEGEEIGEATLSDAPPFFPPASAGTGPEEISLFDGDELSVDATFTSRSTDEDEDEDEESDDDTDDVGDGILDLDGGLSVDATFTSRSTDGDADDDDMLELDADVTGQAADADAMDSDADDALIDEATAELEAAASSSNEEDALEALAFSLLDEEPGQTAPAAAKKRQEMDGDLETLEFSLPDEPIAKPGPIDRPPVVDEDLESVTFSLPAPPSEPAEAPSGEDAGEISDDLLEEIGVEDAEATLPLGATMETLFPSDAAAGLAEDSDPDATVSINPPSSSSLGAELETEGVMELDADTMDFDLLGNPDNSILQSDNEKPKGAKADNKKKAAPADDGSNFSLDVVLEDDDTEWIVKK